MERPGVWTFTLALDGCARAAVWQILHAVSAITRNILEWENIRRRYHKDGNAINGPAVLTRTGGVDSRPPATYIMGTRTEAVS